MMEEVRKSIQEDKFLEYKEDFLSKFQLYLFEDKIQFFYNNHPIKFENTILLFDYLKNHFLSPKEKNFSIENYF